MLKVRRLFERRKARVRYAIKCFNDKPRFSVFRSNNNIYAQIIDDSKGHTIASASTLDLEIKKEINNSGGNIAAAIIVGRVIAKRAITVGVKNVVFDRGGYKYHGRIKALAMSAREMGLKF